MCQSVVEYHLVVTPPGWGARELPIPVEMVKDPDCQVDGVALQYFGPTHSSGVHSNSGRVFATGIELESKLLLFLRFGIGIEVKKCAKGFR
eukprot:gene6157-biopygen13538